MSGEDQTRLPRIRLHGVPVPLHAQRGRAAEPAEIGRADGPYPPPGRAGAVYVRRPRVFRPDSASAPGGTLFEPNAAPLWEMARNRLFGSLSEALAGEVDPKTLKVDVGPGPGQPEVLLVKITYTIAALGKEETLEIRL